MTDLLKLLREDLDVEISDSDLLEIFEEVSGCSTGSALSSSGGGRLEPLAQKKAVEKTKRIVKRRGRIVEAITRVKNRVRNGGATIQRRKKVSSRKGWTYSSNQRRVRRIDALERMRRSRAAKRSASKRLTKKTMANIKRQRSMRMRRALGWNKRRR